MTVYFLFFFLVRTITKDLQIMGIIPTNWDDIHDQILFHPSNCLLDSLFPRIVFHENATWRYDREDHHVFLVLAVHLICLRYEVKVHCCCCYFCCCYLLPLNNQFSRIARLVWYCIKILNSWNCVKNFLFNMSTFLVFIVDCHL